MVPGGAVVTILNWNTGTLLHHQRRNDNHRNLFTKQTNVANYLFVLDIRSLAGIVLGIFLNQT